EPIAVISPRWLWCNRIEGNIAAAGLARFFEIWNAGCWHECGGFIQSRQRLGGRAIPFVARVLTRFNRREAVQRADLVLKTVDGGGRILRVKRAEVAAQPARFILAPRR